MEERLAAVESHRFVNKVIPYAPLGITENWLQKYNIDLVCGNACITGKTNVLFSS